MAGTSRRPLDDSDTCSLVREPPAAAGERVLALSEPAFDSSYTTEHQYLHLESRKHTAQLTRLWCTRAEMTRPAHSRHLRNAR